MLLFISKKKTNQLVTGKTKCQQTAALLSLALTCIYDTLHVHVIRQKHKNMHQILGNNMYFKLHNFTLYPPEVVIFQLTNNDNTAWCK